MQENDKIKVRNVYDVFDKIAEKYVERFSGDWEFKSQIDDFANRLNIGSKILDIGCGDGYISNYLYEKGLKPIGIDFNEKMISMAKKLNSNIEYHIMNILDIDKNFEPNTFDGILAFYCLYFIPKNNFSNIINFCNKLLKTNGKMLVLMQVGNNEESYVDEILLGNDKSSKALFVNFYTEDTLKQIFKNSGFNIIYSIYKENIDEDEIGGSGRVLMLIEKEK